MKYLIIFSFILGTTFATNAQKLKEKLYNPKADAKADLAAAVLKAKNEAKHVFIQIGGNWCGWCYIFHDFCKEDDDIRNLIQKNYVPLKINYSRENKNDSIMTTLGYPQRFGFPVFVIINQEGDVIHIQNSGLLEEEKGYNRNKVLGFFKNWSVKALDPSTYN